MGQKSVHTRLCSCLGYVEHARRRSRSQSTASKRALPRALFFLSFCADRASSSSRLKERGDSRLRFGSICFREVPKKRVGKACGDRDVVDAVARKRRGEIGKEK